MQADGLAKRLEHAHAKTAVIGISGGLDSCLALLVAVRAMKQLGRPTSDVLAVTMPCFGTTHRTRSNAEILCDELAVSFTEIDIANTVHSHFKDIGQDESVLDVTFENGQARVRTLELMDTANRTGGLVVGTGDLSELALGWATYNGDHMSMYGVNAGVPKTLVRHLVQYEADIAASAELRRVLLDILDTPVSPELLPAKDGEISQKTEDLVGPYELHDFYLYYVLRFGFGPSKIFRLAKAAFAGRAEYPDEVLYKWLRNFYWRFFAQQFKRSCLPDGPKVGSVTLSPRGDWRMPSDAAAALAGRAGTDPAQRIIFYETTQKTADGSGLCCRHSGRSRRAAAGAESKPDRCAALRRAHLWRQQHQAHLSSRKRRRLRCGHRLPHRPHQDPGRRGPLCGLALP